LFDSGIERYYDFLDHNVIAGSVSQNCGRQPHIVSTNHSNLIAVGPNRSLASRQAIVWTYRPESRGNRVAISRFSPVGILHSREEERTSFSPRFSFSSFGTQATGWKKSTGAKKSRSN